MYIIEKRTDLQPEELNQYIAYKLYTLSTYRPSDNPTQRLSKVTSIVDPSIVSINLENHSRTVNVFKNIHFSSNR